jgi:hypothetical protein
MCEECIATIRSLPSVVDRRRKKARARQLVAWALENRILKKPKPLKCEWCGKIVNWLESHHADYDKPLLVEFVCKKCHFLYHKMQSPKAKKGAKEKHNKALKKRRRYVARKHEQRIQTAEAFLDAENKINNYQEYNHLQSIILEAKDSLPGNPNQKKKD